MTKSELIAKLAARFPQLVAKDAELAVKMILDAMGNFAGNEDGSANTFYSGNYFLVTYTVVNHPQFVGNPDIARLVVTVDWPYNAAPANRTRRTFVSTFGRMQ